MEENQSRRKENSLVKSLLREGLDFGLDLIPVYGVVRHVFMKKPISRRNNPELTDKGLKYAQVARNTKGLFLGAYNFILFYNLEKFL